MDLSALLSPKTVAVIGAANDTHLLRGRTLKVMLQHAFAGKIYPVSRSAAQVQGIKAFSSIDKIPERIDLAVLIIPAEFVPDELERCGRAGVRAALIITSGFSEQSGAQGSELQTQLQDIAARYSMLVCGPNTEGFANTALALCATFSPVVENISLAPHGHHQGHVAVVAQSGGMGFAFFDRGRAKQIPFSYVVTTGNEACLEVFDAVEYLLDEGSTEVFLLFIENIKNAATFKRVAAKALKAGKPIIVTKIGHSEAGQRAAASHTAALAGAYDVYRAMFRYYGIIEGADIEEMVDLAGAFSIFKNRLPCGVRVGIGTASGGGGGWLADACVAAGLQVPHLDTETRAVIDRHLPSYGTSQNPVDGTAQAIREIGYSELARLIATSPLIDAVIMVTSLRSADTLRREAENLRRVAHETRKPILMWSYTLPCEESVQLLSEAGLPLITNMQHCARVVAALANYRKRSEDYLLAAEDTSVTSRRRDSVAETLRSSPEILCEYQVATLLRQYDIEIVEAQLVESVDAAVLAWRQLHASVALKVQSPQLPHKTEANAVALCLNSEQDIRAAYATILDNAKTYAPQAQIHGVLVQRMASSGVEMLLGIHRDPLFGPMLMLGLGGIHVEVLRDYALTPVPLNAAEAGDLIAQLRGHRLLDGVRGAPAADKPALIELIVKLSQFAFEQGDAIVELDLNPVIVHALGSGVSVVDALLKVNIGMR